MIFVGLVIAEAAPSSEGPKGGSPSAPWTTYLRQVNEALAQKNVGAAVRAWHDAYVTALGSRHWEGMVEVGDAYLRIGDLSGFRKESEAKARRIYLSALFQARAQGSLDGVLRVADAFLVLGDREVVYQCLRIAESLADRGRDASARVRVRAFEARLRDSFPGVESPEFIGQVFPP
jgi:hypothetical protein